VTNRCAVAKTGALYCWGQNVFGPLGTGDTTGRTSPTQVGTDLDWKTVAPGKDHTCALKTDGKLHCWGWNAFGEVGDGSTTQRTAPVPVDAANTYLDVSTRGVATCAVRADRKLLCWGTNGNLGVAFKSTPTEIDGATDWAKIRLSLGHACATKTTGQLYCWGSNDRGQLALPMAAGNLSRTSPVRVGLDTDWVDVAVGEGFSCGTKPDGSIRCWGTNGRGELAYPPGGHLTPTRIGAAGEFAHVSVGANNVCAVRKNGTLACWGRAGALPTAGISAKVPVTIGLATDWKTAKSGYAGACATKTNDVLHCWANGTSPAATSLTVSTYDVGLAHQCALAGGALYCWGEGIFGKLGNGSNASLASPTKVGADTWNALALSGDGSCGVKADGTLVCFGFGFTGFEKMGSATTWTQIAGSKISQTFFGLQGSSLHRWDFAVGPNASGVENDWLAIAAGEDHVCGIRDGGTLWCKGWNDQGQLGDGTLIRRNDVVQVGSATDWSRISASGSTTCGLRGAGDLYCWGANDYGAIGDGAGFRTTPTLVP
jgi:alpha-tubulin suppressor-like RCC1 family protein